MTRSSILRFTFALVAFAAVRGHAQRPDSSAFSELRADGNGVARLRAIINVGFDNQTAAGAFTDIAERARLNLTMDPTLVELDRRVIIPPHERSVAVALLEIARISGVAVRVSARGQVVIVARPNTVVSRRAPEPGPVTLPPLKSEAERNARETFATRTNAGALSMSGRTLRMTPSFVEPDVLRAVQLLPGIEVRSDWTAGFSVRGGESDQSIVMLDGYPIYNPYHLGGVFSTFIDPTVGRVELRKGALPARFGGRLSGVLDVTSAEPTSNELQGVAEVSLVSSTASVGRTFAEGNGSWMIAGRRTYADAIANLVRPDAFPYHFQDVQGHVTRAFSNGLRVSATAYTGLDALSGSSGSQRSGAWGNSVVGVTLAKTFYSAPRIGRWSLGDSVAVEQRVSSTRFDAHIDLPLDLFGARNNITELRFAGSASAFRARGATTLGYEFVRQRVFYHAASAFPFLGDIIPFDSLGQRTNIASLFANNVWRPDTSLIVETGARLEVIQPLGWSGLLPRVSIKYLLGPNTAITAGGGLYAQWMHSLGREEEPVQPLQFWVVSDSVTSISKSRDALLGLEHWLGSARVLRVEGFYKRYYDLLVPNVYADGSVHGDEFDRTNGTSYGVDFLLRQLDGGPFSGWIAYTYALSARTGPDGVRYFPMQDRRHNLNLVGSWRRGPYTWGARVNLASGLPHTPALGGYLRGRYNPVTRTWYPTTDFSNAQTIRGERNSERLPWYSRVDLSVNRTGRLFGAAFTPYASIVNVFNASNPAGFLYTFDNRGRRASFPNLPFAPTFGVTIAY